MAPHTPVPQHNQNSQPHHAALTVSNGTASQSSIQHHNSQIPAFGHRGSIVSSASVASALQSIETIVSTHHHAANTPSPFALHKHTHAPPVPPTSDGAFQAPSSRERHKKNLLRLKQAIQQTDTGTPKVRPVKADPAKTKKANRSSRNTVHAQPPDAPTAVRSGNKLIIYASENVSPLLSGRPSMGVPTV